MRNPNSLEINSTKERLRDFKRDLRNYELLNKISDKQLTEFSLDLDKDSLNSKIQVTKDLIVRDEAVLVKAYAKNEEMLSY